MTAHFSVKQTAKILGFSTNTIYKYLNDGTLTARRTKGSSGRFRISQTAIEKFLGHPLEEDQLAKINQPHSQPQPPATPIPPAAVITTQSPEPAISLKTTRALIILSLVMILVDVLVSQDFSLIEQIIRLLFLSIAIVIAYQYGGLTHTPIQKNN